MPKQGKDTSKVTLVREPAFSYKALDIELERPLGEVRFSHEHPTNTDLRSDIAQNLRYQITVPRATFMRFGIPPAFMKLKIEKKNAAGAWTPTVAADGIVLRCPQAFVASIGINVNSEVLPHLTLSGSDLHRAMAINSRFAPPPYDGMKDWRSLLFTKHMDKDLTTVEANRTEQGIKWREAFATGSTYAPMFFPMWPFTQAFLEQKLSRRKLDNVKNKYFPELTEITVFLKTNPASELLKYVHYTRTINAAAPAIEEDSLRVKVEELFFVLQTQTFGEDSRFLSDFRSARNKSGLMFPMVQSSLLVHQTVTGASASVLKHDNSKCHWRYFLLFFVPREVAIANKALPTEDVSFPSRLRKVEVRFDGSEESLIGGPLEYPGTSYPHESKLLFYQKAAEYLTVRPTFVDYFAEDFCSQAILVNLWPYADRFGSLAAIPSISIHLKWGATGCPADMEVHMLGFANSAYVFHPSNHLEVISDILPK